MAPSSRWVYALALHYKAEAGRYSGTTLANECRKRALRWAFKAAASRSPSALKLLAFFYETGFGTPACKKFAFECYLLCESDAEAMFKLAACYEKGIGVTCSLDKAIEVLKKSVSKCNHEGRDPSCPRSSAQYRLAKLLQKTGGRHEVRGLETFNACYEDHGHIRAWIWIADNFTYKSHHELERLAESLLETSQGRDRLKLKRYLGSMYYSHHDARFLEYLKQAVSEGDIFTQRRYGRFLSTEDDLQSVQEAITLIKHSVQNRFRKCHRKHPKIGQHGQPVACKKHVCFSDVRMVSRTYSRVARITRGHTWVSEISQMVWALWEKEDLDSYLPPQYINFEAQIIFFDAPSRYANLSAGNYRNAAHWMEQQPPEDVEMWMSRRDTYLESVSVIQRVLPQPIVEEILPSFFSLPIYGNLAEKRRRSDRLLAKRQRISEIQ